MTNDTNRISFKQVYKGSKGVLGSELKYPETTTPVIERWLVTLPPNSFGEWHIHLVPEFFYVEAGTLYVVNEKQEKTYAVTTFGKGEHGLTDCHVPQFIWNPDALQTVSVIAIYIGCESISATKSLNMKPNKDLLGRLMKESIAPNLTDAG